MARLAPGGGQLAVMVQDLSEISLWTYDLARSTFAPLARGGEVHSPIWTPNGQRLVFSWLKDGRRLLAWQPADGTTPPELLSPGSGVGPSSWTPDGRELVVITDDDLAVVRIENGRASMQRLMQTPAQERWPEFSPDGHWLAYGSNDSGRFEVYVQPYPGLGPRTQVSIEGGRAPAWDAKGHELFFLSPPDAAGKERMMVAPFEPGSPPRIGPAQLLFEIPRELILGATRSGAAMSRPTASGSSSCSGGLPCHCRPSRTSTSFRTGSRSSRPKCRRNDVGAFTFASESVLRTTCDKRCGSVARRGPVRTPRTNCDGSNRPIRCV